MRSDLRRAAVAASGGLCWALSHPPVGAWPLSFLVLPLLLVAIHGPELRRWRSPALGFLWGFVAFLGTLTWSLNITPGGELAWPLLAAVQGAWLGAFAVIARAWIGRPWSVAAISVLYVGIEVLRGSVPMGGFGWGELSYAHAGVTWLTPIARLVGGHGITLVVALAGAFLFEAWRRGADAIRELDGSATERAAAMLPHAQPALLGLAATLVVSVLATIEPPATVATAEVLIVQGNGTEDWGVGGIEEDRLVAASHLELTRAALLHRPADLVVWPESAVDDDPARRGDLAAILDEGGALTDGRLVAGVKLDGPRDRTFLNTLVHVGADGAWAEPYVKRQLVPFGEFVPFRSALTWVPPLRAVPYDGVPGEGPVDVDVHGIRLAAAICFETLFGDVIRDNVLGAEQRAQLVVAITNDASFGRGSETAQHLAQSRLRAVETGRWVVHAAVSGASAFVDPEGALHEVTEVFEATTLRAQVGLVDGTTPFLVTGDVLGRLLALATVVEIIRRARAIAVQRSSRRRDPIAATESTT